MDAITDIRFLQGEIRRMLKTAMRYLSPAQSAEYLALTRLPEDVSALTTVQLRAVTVGYLELSQTVNDHDPYYATMLWVNCLLIGMEYNPTRVVVTAPRMEATQRALDLKVLTIDMLPAFWAAYVARYGDEA